MFNDEFDFTQLEVFDQTKADILHEESRIDLDDALEPVTPDISLLYI